MHISTVTDGAPFAFRCCLLTLLLQLMIGVDGVLAAASQTESIRLFGPTMGTTWSVTVNAPPEDVTEQSLRAAIEEKLLMLNQQMSTYIVDSEISRFNAQASAEWFPVSREFAEVVSRSRGVYEATDGSFDPTVSPLVNLWGFGADRPPSRVPDDADVTAALEDVGLSLIEVREDPPALRKLRDTVTLNLSAIAKGYAVDVIGQTISGFGAESWMVEIGGEICVGVPKSDGSLWRLAVQDPQSARAAAFRVVEVSGKAMATSGDYRNYFEVDGVRYSHTIDPVTGRPLSRPAASVSVIADDCLTADAWATALMVLGVERGLPLATQHNVAAMFITRTDDEKLQLRRNELFSEFLAEKQPTARSVVLDEVFQPASAGVVEEVTPSERSDAGEKAGSSLWITAIAALAIFGLAIVGMAAGVILSNRRLKGSCGGLSAMSGDGTGDVSPCSLCTTPADQCSNSELREFLRNRPGMKVVDGDGNEVVQQECQSDAEGHSTVHESRSVGSASDSGSDPVV